MHKLKNIYNKIYKIIKYIKYILFTIIKVFKKLRFCQLISSTVKWHIAEWLLTEFSSSHQPLLWLQKCKSLGFVRSGLL